MRGVQRHARRGVVVGVCALLAGGMAACGSDSGGTQAAAGVDAAECTADVRTGVLVMAQLNLFDNMVKGYKEGFAEETGIPVGDLEFDEQNAQGDAGSFQSMARAFAQGSNDLIAVVGTPPTIALAQATKEKPIVTISVGADPKVLGIADSAERPGRNVTGSIDIVPEGEIVDGILALQPDAKKIGTIYTSGNDAVVDFNAGLSAAAKGKGLELVETAIANSNDLLSAARSMIGKVDAIVVGRDGAVAAGLPAIAAEAQRNKRPLYLAYTGPDALVPGVVGGLGSDETEVGRLAGQVAGKICKGADPADTAFARFEDYRWQFRKDTLEADGLEVPPALAEKSDIVGG